MALVVDLTISDHFEETRYEGESVSGFFFARFAGYARAFSKALILFLPDGKAFETLFDHSFRFRAAATSDLTSPASVGA